jgi:hypothetical protein
MLSHKLDFVCSCSISSYIAEAFPCDNVRRDWRTLTPGQQATYISAINQLQATRQYPNWLQAHTNPAMDRFAHNSPGLFRMQYVSVTYSFSRHNVIASRWAMGHFSLIGVHTLFAAWHRYYVWNYENQLRSLGGVYSCISIPYWDWTADAASGGGYIGANSQVCGAIEQIRTRMIMRACIMRACNCRFHKSGIHNQSKTCKLSLWH